MKWVFIILSLIILGLFAYHAVRLGRLVYKGQQLAKQAVKYERTLPRPDRKFLIIGDSMGVGTGAESPEKTIAGYFGADYPNVDIINLSENGLRLQTLQKKMLELDEQRYALIVLIIGANDIIRFASEGSTEKVLDRVLEEARAMSDRVVVLHSGNIGLAPFFPDFIKPVMTRRSRAFRDFYIKLAEKYKVVYVDLFTERNDDPENPNYPWLYAADGLHLNGEGQRVWYDRIREAMRDARALP